ncbi:MAG: PAS domain S-box protein [Planctomycetota bacterium]
MTIKRKTMVAFGVLVILLWPLDAIVDYYFYFDRTFWQLLVTDVPSHEVYVRLIMMGIAAVCGLLCAYLVGRLERKTIQAERSEARANERNRQIREVSSRFQKLVEFDTDGLIVVNTDGVVQFANQAARRMFNKPSEEMIGTNLGVPAADDEPAEIEIIGDSASRNIVEMRSVDMEWKGDLCSLISVRDITERKVRENTIERLNSLLSTIRNVNRLIVQVKDLNKLMQDACNLLAEARGYECCSIALLNEESGMISPVARAGFSTSVDFAISPEGDGEAPECAREVLKTGDMCLRLPAKDCPACAYDNAEAQRPSVTVPMRLERDVVGLLHVHIGDVGEIKEREKELLEGVAQDLAFAWEKWRSEQELQESENKFRQIFDSANDAMYVHNLTEEGMPGRFIEVNRVACEMLGYSHEEFLQMSPMDIDPPERQDELVDIMPAILGDGQKTFEGEHVAKDGSRVPVEISSHLAEIGGKRRVLSIARDISERKRREDKILRLNSLLRAIRSLNKAIVEADEAEELLQRSCDLLLENTRYTHIWVTTFDEAGKPFSTGFAGRDEQFEEFLAQIESGFMPRCAEQAREKPGVPFVLFPERDCGDCPIIDLHAGSKSIQCGFPENAKISGLLGFRCPEDHELGTEERDLIAEVALDLAHGLQRIEAEKEVEESEQRYRRLFETAQDGMLILDTDTKKIIDANPFIRKILGYSRAELMGKKLWEIGPFKHIAENRERFKNLVEQGYVRYEDLPMETKDGEEVSVEFVSNTYMAGDKKVVQCNIRDITERKRAEERLQRAQKQVIDQERRQALTQMASGIAHDFNNALSTIKGFTDLLLRSKEKLNDTEIVTQYLERVRTAASNASQTVRRMRKFYRPSEGTNFGPVDINSLIQESIAMTQPRWREQARAGGGEITIEKDLGDIPPVEGDENELSEMLTNLIFNAVDAMPQGGTLSFSTREKNGKVVLRVGDTGKGMSKETREQCFDPFYTTKHETGTGLGLSTVHGTVQRHNGKIDVESEKGEGTTFRIVLPAHQKGFKEEEKSPESEKRTGLRILVAEDEEEQQVLIAEYLRMDDHQPDVVPNGREGLRKFMGGYYDLVITDRSMPEVNGDQFAMEVREEAPEKPVIMLTGFGDIMDAVGDKPENVDVVLSKPVTLEKLRGAISRVTAGADDSEP